jgi:hypothetical protein
VPIPGNDSDGVQGGMDPGDEAQTPISGVQADDAWMDRIEPQRPLKPRAGERSIVDIGGRKQKGKPEPRQSNVASYALQAGNLLSSCEPPAPLRAGGEHPSLPP